MTAKLSNDIPNISEYLTIGFSIDRILPADFSYVIRNKRVSSKRGNNTTDILKKSNGKMIYDSGSTIVSMEI